MLHCRTSFAHFTFYVILFVFSLILFSLDVKFTSFELNILGDLFIWFETCLWTGEKGQSSHFSCPCNTKGSAFSVRGHQHKWTSYNYDLLCCLSQMIIRYGWTYIASPFRGLAARLALKYSRRSAVMFRLALVAELVWEVPETLMHGWTNRRYNSAKVCKSSTVIENKVNYGISTWRVTSIYTYRPMASI